MMKADHSTCRTNKSWSDIQKVRRPGQEADYKMEKLLLLMVVFATCNAEPQDLTGKVFVFPKESTKDHVKLLTSKTEFNAVTVCLRFQTDLTRNYALFSLSTPTHNNEFVIFKTNSGDVLRIHARDPFAEFLSLSFVPNTWHAMCATWSSDKGIAQLWLDGKPTIRRFIQTGAITGAPITILGQEQDSYGGGFDANQSFLGMITKVHMWDSVIPASQIKRYMEDKHFTPGNVFNWRALDFEITGQVVVDEETEVM
ncbi:serum amyloid P-component-like [Centropristis striata]|uniref:serum amyloid P-component-like n=1 Tax=Centropristis striata TaxID=184440 RepID=UPI0027E01B07|nr:serum amyloid P-component-like [Centropristis striata]